jgi:hypothetical protein
MLKLRPPLFEANDNEKISVCIFAGIGFFNSSGGAN